MDSETEVPIEEMRADVRGAMECGMRSRVWMRVLGREVQRRGEREGFPWRKRRLRRDARVDSAPGKTGQAIVVMRSESFVSTGLTTLEKVTRYVL